MHPRLMNISYYVIWLRVGWFGEFVVLRLVCFAFCIYNYNRLKNVHFCTIPKFKYDGQCFSDDTKKMSFNQLSYLV